VSRTRAWATIALLAFLSAALLAAGVWVAATSAAAAVAGATDRAVASDALRQPTRVQLLMRSVLIMLSLLVASVAVVGAYRVCRLPVAFDDLSEDQIELLGM
jgi:uncharacterized membrane protein YjgN (DUF898 family)